MDLSTLSDKELLKLKKQTEYEISKYKNLQLAKKVTLNSSYGAQGNKYFRYYDWRLASSITLTGQLIIKTLEKKVNLLLNRLCKTSDIDYVIASDTDSLYLNVDPLVKKLNIVGDHQEVSNKLDEISNKIISKEIDKYCNEIMTGLGAYDPSVIKMKRESICSSAIWTAKKRYVLNVIDNEGVRYQNPKMKVVGLDVVKSSIPVVCKNSLKECISLIMNKDNEVTSEYIKSFRKSFKLFSPEQISIPKSVFGLNKYSDDVNIFKKACPIHVRGSLLYNYLLKRKKIEKKYQKIQDGDKIKYIYLFENCPIGQNIIAFPDVLPDEFGLHNYIDHENQFDKTFLSPIKSVMDAIGWDVELTSCMFRF